MCTAAGLDSLGPGYSGSFATTASSCRGGGVEAQGFSRVLRCWLSAVLDEAPGLLDGAGAPVWVVPGGTCVDGWTCCLDCFQTKCVQVAGLPSLDLCNTVMLEIAD